jgi:crotonobetainyl-CoA:carnitine CoA-transferase CaiB-like acyl-CoA transferase
MTSNGTGPLAGIKVLELCSMYAGPTAGRMLRDLGASVIKVEDPKSGDYARQWMPQAKGVSLGFIRLNSGKRSVAVDLRSAEGRDLVTRLAAQSDVVTESFRPGRLEAWGLGYDVLSADNPGLVLGRVSGYGQTGPYRSRPGFGTVAEAISGFAFTNGWPHTPPTSPQFGFADSIAGISLALGVSAALYRRASTGRGEVVDVALYEPLMFILGDAILRYTATGEITQRVGNTTGAASPRGVYQAGDGGWLSIAASSQVIAERLFAAMERPDLVDDPKFATNKARMQHNEELQALVVAWVGSRPRAEVLSILDRYEVVAAAVNDARDIVADPHFQFRSLFPVPSSEHDSLLVPGPLVRTDDDRVPEYPFGPVLGEHTASVLGEELGLSADDIASLERRGTISTVGVVEPADDPLHSGAVA